MTMVINGTSGITFPSNLVQGDAGLGVSQTYQSFTVGTQRVNGTTYTNTTGRPIAILIGQNAAAATTVLVNGVTLSYINGAVAPQYTLLVVPPSGTYATGTSAPSSWVELR